MKEVSCKAIAPFLDAFDRRSLPRTELIRGTQYSLRHVETQGERVDWDAFMAMMANVRTRFTEAGIIAIGEQGLETTWMRSVMAIGRTLFSAPAFYRWLIKSGGMGNLMFSNIVPSHREIDPEHICVELHMAQGYQPSREFFLMAHGGFQGLPKLLGLDGARVQRTDLDDGVRFEITIPPDRALRARLRQFIARRFDASKTATQLDSTMHALEERYGELEIARNEVERQRALLDLAYQLGQRILNQRDIGALAKSVTESLVGNTSIRAARLTTVRPVELVTTAGQSSGDPTFVVELAHYGSIAVWADSAANARGLLDLIVPTVTLGLDNAGAYHELAAYQAGLEALVEQRTLELSSAVEQLREAQTARQRFFGNISHEIRTPLTLVVLAAADVEARAGAQLDPRSRQSLGSITEAARKLLRLVDELLLLAAGQENKLVINPEPTDLAALIGQMLAGWRPAAEAAELVLDARIVERLTAVVDPVAIERIASNLVSNAVKYTPKGGRVEIELTDEPDGLRFSVSDTGPGIDADLASRLFGRFERSADAGTRATGTGIGLALVKQLVEAHGGTVSALPRVGGGTEMRVVFPVSLKTDATATVARLRLAARETSSSTIKSGDVFRARGLSQGTILVAEDDPMLAERIALLLSEEYTVVVGLDGEAALALVKQHQPQLLITDVDMPKMNGIELAKQFRATTGDRVAPIIILSAVMDLGTRIAGLDAGAVDYIGKPFDPRELEARVRSHFRMRDLAVRLQRAEQLSSLGILTSGLAHELRNPANGIVNAIAPLREMLPRDVSKGAIALLEVLEDCAEQVGFLSRQLLGFRGTSELEMQLVELPELVERATSLAQQSLTDIEVRLKVGPERSVMCAAPLLVQVLTNLIENGAHAAKRGGWVEVLVSHRDGRFMIEVSDSGPGVPTALRERIFEPFFTTKPQGVGTGLGLSVARAIVQRHGGVLELRERGPRAAFVIELPDSHAA